jgi:diaminopimelate decarboxylase
MKIYISGLYSGTNPQPGVGIARSIRTAYPNATLIGVEYSNRCSGIHWHDFDEIWLQRPWDELNLTTHAEEIKKVLDEGGLWISSIDLEIMWFAKVFPEGHPNLLTPPMKALEQVQKPAISAHEGLPVQIPTFVTTEISDWDLHAFCREHDWKVWLKGPYYEAARTRSWAEFEEKRYILSNAWATEKLFLQAHVSGYEESVTLSAYKGELIDCVRMRKRDLTELSKTWAGDVSEVEEEFLAPLREIIRRINWTGGAELEMVRDADNQLWLLEVNPRFPAWIHGSTITGRNIPASLIEGATGIKAGKSPVLAEEFTRVVMEIPVRTEFPLSPLPEPLGGVIGHSLKHPSGLVQFANVLHNSELFEEEETNGNGGKKSKFLAPDVPPSFIDDLSGLNLTQVETPASLFLESTAADYFSKARGLSDELSTDALKVTNAYSLKTNPDARLIKLALDSGFLAETISLLEVRKAIEVGFKPEQIVLNGPAKWWRREILPEGKFYSIFCDSIEELNQVIEDVENGDVQTEHLGVRLRTPNVVSRFGIPVGTPEDFEKLIEGVQRLPKETKFAVHFHMASSNVGVGSWWHLFESILRWCSSIEALTGRLIEILDVGGGWFPEDLQRDSAENFRKAIALIPEFLPHVKQIISEPGKALAQPSMAVAMQILELRNSDDAEVCEAVVDGSIAELPMYFFYPHRILYKDSNGGCLQPLGRGKTKLLGRLCMEHDIVAHNVELPENAQVGDILVFCDAGAYDRSMSYVFGRG